MAVKWHLIDEEDADLAASLLLDFSNRRVNLIAPDFIYYEVSSALLAASFGKRPRLTHGECLEAVGDFLALALPTFRDDALIFAAMDLVYRHGCAFYDALYLALAEHLAIPFITADHKLYRRTRHLPLVKWIGDYSLPESSAKPGGSNAP